MPVDKSAVRSGAHCAVPLAVSAALCSFASCGPVLAQSAPPDNAPPAGQSGTAPVVLPPITIRPRDTAHSVVTPPPSSPTNEGAGQALVVSPTTIPTATRNTASSVTVLTSGDINARQLQTMPDALATVPGLNVVQAGGPGAQTSVFLRGTASDHVKVLVDGIDMSDPSNPNTAFDFGQLLTGDVERIEVLRGPQSGLYGSDAIGGVISVTTKQGSGPPRITASVEGGSFGTSREQVGLSGSQDGFSYAVNVQHFQAASVPVTPLNLLAPAGCGCAEAGEPRNNDFYDNWTYSTKLGKKISDTLAVNFVTRYTESDHRFTLDDFSTFPNPAVPERTQSMQLDHQLFGRAEVVWSPVNGLTNYFGVNYSRQWTWSFDPNPDSGAPPATDFGTRIKYDYRGEVQVAPGQLVVMGAEHQDDTLRTDSTTLAAPADLNKTFSQHNDAGWLQLQSELTRQLHLVANVRYDANGTFGDHMTWRVAPVYTVPGIDTKLKATYGTGFKAPTLYELFVNSPFTVANPNLKPEESTGWDAGFEQPIANNRFRFGATYFRNDLKNLINPFFLLGEVSTAVNVDAATMSGVESFAAWTVTGDLNLRFDYTYLNVESTNIIAQERRPKNKASATAVWQATDRLTLSSTLLYVGSWLDVDRESQLGAIVKAPAFTTLNLAAAYKASNDVSYTLRIDNLFNKQYEDPLGFLRPGIGIYGGIRLTLDGLSPPNGGAAAFVPPFLRNGGAM